MTLSLSACVVVEVLRGAKPHYRRFVEAAVDAGDELRICSLVLNQLAQAALTSDRPQARMDQIDALVAHVPVEPWTGEDAITSARLQVEWRRTVLEKTRPGVTLPDLLTAGQALNRGWTLVVDAMPHVVAGVPAILWGDPAGPVDLTRPGFADLARARR
ncbi:hypothetical protein [Phenylobacterium sp.]|jgi:predicted nucleic acid-binding protein|uniref:hypothetical protein n=1 Tax=Phenylobacterium sp. TaxID=1871053 RepID=UPI002E31163E|nr:hypothetical protein [Phenylobacterium sp.]HEX2559934.1 hypothetical protein [Phenylobacterium sp.]